MGSPIDTAQEPRTAGAGRRSALRAPGRLRGLGAPFRTRYGKGIGLIFAFLALVLFWNVAHFPVGQSGDAQDHFKYTDTLRYKHHLPGPSPRPPGTPPGTRIENTGQWYNPPVFYLAAVAIEAATDKATDLAGLARQGDRRHKAVQIFNVLLALGVALLAFLTARELFPRSRIVQVSVLAFVALSPTFVRTAIVYHAQMMATLFSTAALYVVIRALVRRQLTVKAGVVAGVLLALGMLTRHFVLATTVAMLATLGLYYLFTRQRDALRMGGLIALCVVVLTAPWYIHQQVKYHDAFAASAKPPNQSFFDRQPPGFYVGGTVKGVFTQPYRPKYDNHMPQTVYTDWWGDYFLYFDVPSKLRRAHIAASNRLHRALRLPDRYHNERVRQSYVGVLPTLLMLAGMFGLIRLGIRRREAHLLAIPLMVGAIALEALWVYIGYPTSDGDIMRQTYLLTALPPTAFAVGWAISRLREKSAVAFGLVVAALGVAAVVDLNFVVLHHFVGRAG